MKLTKQTIIQAITSPEVKTFLQNNGVKHLSLVWSYSKDAQSSDSDIDFVIEKNADAKISLITYMQISQFLENIFHKKIDIANEKYLNQHIKTTVLADKVIIF